MQNQTLYKNTLFLNILLAFLYVFTGKLSTIVFVSEKIITFSVFPPEGIALAFALYFGKKIIPGIFIGQVILALINELSVIQAVGIGIGNSLEAFIAIYLWNRYKKNAVLETFQDYFYLMGMIIFILQPFSATFGNLILSINSKFNIHNLFYWYIGNVLGQILFTPFLITLFNTFKPRMLKNFIIYGSIFGFFIYLLIFIIDIKSVFILLMFSSVITAYYLIKNGLICGLYLNIVLYYEIILAKIFHKNIFSTLSSFENTFNFDLFVIYNTTLIFIVGIFIEQQKNFSKELQKTVKKVTKENKQQFKYILSQQKFIAQINMIHMLTHQWRQPLNKISLLCELVYTKYKMNSLTDKDMEKFKTNIQNEINALDKTLQQLNSLNQSIKLERFNIKDTIEFTLSLFKNKLKNIDVTIEATNYKILFNKNAFKQIFSIILDNAVEELSDKKIKKIEIKTFKENDNVILIIKDSGGGIKEPDKIFEPYYSTKSKNERGLSLFIAKNLVDKLGAKIEVSNNGGAVFRLIFKG